MMDFIHSLVSFVFANGSWVALGLILAFALLLAAYLGRRPLPEARSKLRAPLVWYAGNRRARRITINVLGVFLILWGAKTFELWITPTLTPSQLFTSPLVGAQAVDVAAVRREPLQEIATYTGTVLPYEENVVYARVDGFVTNLAVYQGDYVHTGELLATLDTSLLEPQLLSAEGAYTRASAQVSRAQAQASYAKAEFRRESALFKAGAVSASDFDLARSQFEQAQAEVAALQQARQEAAAQLTEARVQFGYATVRARMSGWVAQREIYPGVYVKAGEPLLKIGDFNEVRIHFDVAERDLPYVSTGSVVYLRFPQIDPDLIRRTFAGRLGPPGPGGEPTVRATVAVVFPTEGLATRTGTVEVRLPNPGFLLKGDTYVVGDIVKRSVAQALVVPSAAVVDASDGRPVVFVAPAFSDQGQVSMRHVTLGLQTDRYVQVLSGLKPGESVVTLGNRDLADGQTVQIVKHSDEGGTL
jgi:RND family efflux transporter MFP subunit